MYQVTYKDTTGYRRVHICTEANSEDEAREELLSLEPQARIIRVEFVYNTEYNEEDYYE